MIYDVFSKRDETLPDVYKYDELPLKFRNQVNWIWNKSVLRLVTDSANTNPLLLKLHEIVASEHGLDWPFMGNTELRFSITETVRDNPDVGLVLDIIECSMRLLPVFAQVGFQPLKSGEVANAINALNHRFRENGLGYEYNVDAKKLIRIDNTVTHQETIRPTLHLLAGPQYQAANDEYLAALEDYKQGDYEDCLIKCGKAFESLLKTICANRGWTPPPGRNGKPADTAAPFVREIMSKTGLDPSFETTLMVVAAMRNDEAHGKASPPPPPPPAYKARYALNATASAILLVHEAAAAIP
jgi:hypothetical protein